MSSPSSPLPNIYPEQYEEYEDPFSSVDCSPKLQDRRARVFHDRISADGLISRRYEEGGQEYDVIRSSDAKMWSILRFADKRPEIFDPHIGGQSTWTLPSVLFLAEAKEVKNVFQLYIHDVIPGSELKLVILACPLCGHCTEEGGSSGAAKLFQHMKKTHIQFRKSIFTCHTTMGPFEGSICGEKFSTLNGLLHHMKNSDNPGCKHSSTTEARREKPVLWLD
ncbi:hypothetical protein EW145_g3386 [Phellinidium pouzarii]|uniref:C2H2-type domain-containing protein n=1 Tax=Phellinidium pouzarii TaxID=167371 RepID=A0A4S4L964_9AGAM|nr:hypothetical protein EW145_g3386 [Phellinidium pouzarii]